MNMKSTKELQAKAMEMSKEHVEASQEAGAIAMNGFVKSLEGDQELIEARKLGAMIAATDFLETCGTAVVLIDDQ